MSVDRLHFVFVGGEARVWGQLDWAGLRLGVCVWSGNVERRLAGNSEHAIGPGPSVASRSRGGRIIAAITGIARREQYVKHCRD